MTEETEDDIFSKAVSAVEHEQAKKALEILKKIGPNSRYSKQCICLKAECFFQRGWLQDAIRILNNLLVTDPNYLPALKTMTIWLYKLKEYRDTLVYANRFLEIDDSVEEIVSIKNTCQKMSEAEDSEEPELRLTMGDTSTKRLSKLDWRNLMWDGINLKKNGDLEKALEKFESVYFLRPGNIKALDQIISILTELGMHEKLVQRIDERLEQMEYGGLVRPTSLTTQAERFQSLMYKKLLTVKVKTLMKLKLFYEALDSVILLERASPNFKTVKSLKDEIKDKLGSTKKVAILMQTAKKYFKSKKLEDADKTYGKIVELMPSNLTARAFKASCLSALGKRKEAIECCEEAESITPHSKIAMSFVLRTKGEICLKDGNPSEASNCLRKGIELDPNLPTIWIAWGQYAQALFKLEKWEDAEESYAKWGKLRPESKAWSLYWISRCMQHLCKFDEAISCIDQSLAMDRLMIIKLQWSSEPKSDKDTVNRIRRCYISKGKIFSQKNSHEDAIDWYDKALKIRPNDPFVLADKGYSLSNLGMTEDSLECFDRALQAQPNNLSLWTSRYHSMRILGEVQETFKSAENMLRIAPDSFESKIAMGSAMSNSNFGMPNLTRTERLEKALGFANDALRIKEDTRAHFVIAVILKELEKYDEELQTLEDGLSFEPNNLTLLALKSSVLQLKGEIEKAAECTDMLIELAPEKVGPWKSKIELLRQSKQYDGVIKICDDSLKLHPKEPFFWWQKGYALAKKDNHPEAVTCYNESLKLDPFDVFCMSKKGTSLTKMNKLNEAIECLKVANGIDPENDQVISNLGYAYEKKNDYDAAKKYYDAAIDLMPTEFHFSRMAWLCNLREEYDEAVDNYKASLEINDDPVTLALMADALYNSGRADESLEICKELCSTGSFISFGDDKVNRLTLTVMSKIYHDKKMFKESIGYCDQILDSDPKNIEILRIKNASLIEMGDDKEAFRCMDEIRKLQENFWTDEPDPEIVGVKDAHIKELEREVDEKQARIDELEGEEKDAASYRSIAKLPITEIIDPANNNSESEFLEFKSSMRATIDEKTGEIRQEADTKSMREKLSWKISETMDAFLNTNGGVLIIGYYDGDNPKSSEIKRVVGLENDYKTLDRKQDWDGWQLAFTDLVTNDFGPEYQDWIDLSRETYNGELEAVLGKGTMAKIVVKKSSDPVYFDDGKFAIRVNNSTRILTPKETMDYIESHFKK